MRLGVHHSHICFVSSWTVLVGRLEHRDAFQLRGSKFQGGVVIHGTGLC